MREEIANFECFKTHTGRLVAAVLRSGDLEDALVRLLQLGREIEPNSLLSQLGQLQNLLTVELL